MIRSLKDGPCSDCGIRYPPYVMDFDHVRGEKVSEIGLLWHHSDSAILTEIAKCDLVCSNCHRERTHRRLDSMAEQPLDLSDGEGGDDQGEDGTPAEGGPDTVVPGAGAAPSGGRSSSEGATGTPAVTQESSVGV